MKQGDNTLKRFSITGMFGSSGNTENALEKYKEASNAFKMAKDWKNCALANVRCADMANKLGTKHESANYYSQAGDAMKKVELTTAMTYYRLASDIYCELGRFSTAAKQLETVGETLEAEGNLVEAVKCFKQAGDFYMGENAASKASKCFEKVAVHSATLGSYDVAARILEDIGTKCLDNTLLVFNAKKHFLRAGFCFLARGDTIAAGQAWIRYGQLDYTFNDSREGKLLKDLIDACDASNPDQFSQKLFAYDSISKLTPWETSILLRVKNMMSGEGSSSTSGKGKAEEDDGEPDLQ